LKNNNHKQRLILLIVLIGAINAIILTTKPIPVALLSECDLRVLWDERKTMNECANCYNSAVIGILINKLTLILPDRGRSACPTNIIKIGSN